MFKDPRLQNTKKRIIVGMSGGVDSAVTAVMLKKQGHEVIGLFMKNWDEQDEKGQCLASLEYADVQNVCEQFDIPYHSIEFIEEYRDNVFKEFLEEYQAGWTPNPDVLCNREIKFKVFFQKAMELGADFIATGHYCQVGFDKEGKAQLLKGRDPNKDQSYFLYTVKSHILEKVLFPIGHLLKPEVRALAQQWDLSNKNKKDSTGLCFIGERNFRDFLGQFIDASPGEFRSLNHEVVGEHIGAMFYTLGQRKGLGLGGPGEPWYVVDKDPKNNIVYVERDHDHPHLKRKELESYQVSWVDSEFSLGPEMRAKAKIRYRQQDQDCLVIPIGKDSFKVVFDTPQRAITPRQSVVFYKDSVCLGGGMIDHLGKSLYEMNSED
ncbi:MAG: tRNA 2-thiouridine(34) synthase MnmA [Bacteriovoracaceae bacterium]